MIQSMTGYGKTDTVFNDRKVNVELRALNGKATDLRIKYPSKFASKELWIRNHVLKRLDRGRFDMTISIDGDVSDDYTLDEQLFRTYYKQLRSLAQELDVKDQDYFSTIIRIPNVVRTRTEDLSIEEWKVVKELVDGVIEKTREYRIAEGEALKNDISTHLKSIMLNLVEVSTHENDRIDAIKQKMMTNLNGFVEEKKLDENRYEKELIYYLERLDINEEKIRLEQNCIYFKQLLDDPDEGAKGKKLTFISQEIGREINTMGAKAQYAQIQQLVVNMKDNLERIKEQLLNVL